MLLVSLPILAKTINQADSNNFQSVLNLALKGDYQAQRNIAFGYTQWPYKGQEKNPLLGCAWYLVITHSGSLKVNQGDIDNATLNCKVLEPLALQAAQKQAETLENTIFENRNHKK